MIERLKSLKARIEKLKQKCSIATKIQVFKFQPFSLKQKKVLTWWCDTSPVKDKDGIIADGANRSGKTVCMSLSFIMWAMYRFVVRSSRRRSSVLEAIHRLKTERKKRHRRRKKPVM